MLLSSCSILINLFYFNYYGNNYLPENYPIIGIILILIILGCKLQFGNNHYSYQIAKEVFNFFLIMSGIAIATIAVQFTPFPTIDEQIYSFEQKFYGIDLTTVIISWTKDQVLLTNSLHLIYDTLPWQMCYIPLFVILKRKFNIMHEYYFLMLLSTLLGFTFYYFYPTKAPASILDPGLFSEAQKATALKFDQIHNYLQPTTLKGGLIAFPSFHTIWGWYCVYILRNWPMLFKISLVVNIILVMACVLCGWHYTFDIIASVIIILISHFSYYLLISRNTLFFSRINTACKIE